MLFVNYVIIDYNYVMVL